jgi:ferritin-like metal-binding protein YciE
MENSINRTGIGLSPEMAARMLELSVLTKPSTEGSGKALLRDREGYIGAGIPIGSMPALSVDGSESEIHLLDKLGERMAFERTGTRLYEGLINKAKIMKETSTGPDLDNLVEIHDEELKHFFMLKETIRQLGGDPTIQTPSADVSMVISQGALQVVTDPRTLVSHGLQAVLVAELTDNAGWDFLIKLAAGLGYTDMVNSFTKALENEEKHLLSVKQWLSIGMMEKAALA